MSRPGPAGRRSWGAEGYGVMGGVTAVCHSSNRCPPCPCWGDVIHRLSTHARAAHAMKRVKTTNAMMSLHIVVCRVARAKHGPHVGGAATCMVGAGQGVEHAGRGSGGPTFGIPAARRALSLRVAAPSVAAGMKHRRCAWCGLHRRGVREPTWPPSATT